MAIKYAVKGVVGNERALGFMEMALAMHNCNWIAYPIGHLIAFGLESNSIWVAFNMKKKCESCHEHYQNILNGTLRNYELKLLRQFIESMEAGDILYLACEKCAAKHKKKIKGFKKWLKENNKKSKRNKK